MLATLLLAGVLDASELTGEPISLDQAKVHLRVDADATDEDDLIQALIVAAREYVEDYAGLVLTPRTITETAVCLGQWIDLDLWPVTSVLQIRYTPTGGSETILSASAYMFNVKRRPVRIFPVSRGWGLASMQPILPIEIDVLAGFARPDDIPSTVTQAMLLLIQHWFDNRSAAEVGLRAAAVTVPFAVEALLSRWRRVVI